MCLSMRVFWFFFVCVGISINPPTPSDYLVVDHHRPNDRLTNTHPIAHHTPHATQHPPPLKNKQGPQHGALHHGQRPLPLLMGGPCRLRLRVSASVCERECVCLPSLFVEGGGVFCLVLVSCLLFFVSPSLHLRPHPCSLPTFSKIPPPLKHIPPPNHKLQTHNNTANAAPPAPCQTTS